MPTKDVPNPIPRPDPASDNIAVSYDYEVKVKNTGNREIRAFKWEYVFLEPGSNKEVGRRQFESKVRIGRGKSRTVRIRSSLPPADTVDVTQTGERIKARYSEQVRVVSITYADGAVWTEPQIETTKRDTLRAPLSSIGIQVRSRTLR